MSEFKESYFRQRIGDLVSSYENRVAVLLEELESYKAENADLKTQLEATQSVVQEESEEWTDPNQSAHRVPVHDVRPD